MLYVPSTRQTVFASISRDDPARVCNIQSIQDRPGCAPGALCSSDHFSDCCCGILQQPSYLLVKYVSITVIEEAILTCLSLQ